MYKSSRYSIIQWSQQRLKKDAAAFLNIASYTSLPLQAARPTPLYISLLLLT